MSKLYVVNSSRGFDEKTPAAGIAVPVGCVQWFAGSVAPNGWLVCDGSEVSRTQFKALFDVIGTTYGPTASDVFKLPDLMGRFAQGATVPGDVREAGLPNITGWIGELLVGAGESVQGSVTTRPRFGSAEIAWGSGSFYKGEGILNASQENPIYGNSVTVQPPALTLVPIIKAV